MYSPYFTDFPRSDRASAEPLRQPGWCQPAFCIHGCLLSLFDGTVQYTPETCCATGCVYYRQWLCFTHPGRSGGYSRNYLAVALPGDHPFIAIPCAQQEAPRVSPLAGTSYESST